MRHAAASRKFVRTPRSLPRPLRKSTSRTRNCPSPWHSATTRRRGRNSQGKPWASKLTSVRRMLQQLQPTTAHTRSSSTTSTRTTSRSMSSSTASCVAHLPQLARVCKSCLSNGCAASGRSVPPNGSTSGGAEQPRGDGCWAMEASQ